MFEIAARTVVAALEAYALIGLTFALIFVTLGVSRVDPQARGAPVGFRLLILPGSVALWPLLAWRWTHGIREAPIERNPHRDVTP
jgi:hypothetical protein